MTRDLAHYLNLRYRIQLDEETDGTFVAHHPDLPGCIAEGETANEAVENLNSARELWIRVRLEDQLPVPDPVEEPEYSGRLLLRMPKSLHGALARLAEQQGTSLNQLIVSALSAHTKKPSFGVQSPEDVLLEAQRHFSSIWASCEAHRVISSKQQSQWSWSLQNISTGSWLTNVCVTAPARNTPRALFGETQQFPGIRDLAHILSIVDETSASGTKEDRDDEIVVA